MVDGKGRLKPVFRSLVNIRKLRSRVQHQPADRPIPKLLDDVLCKFVNAGKATKVERECFDCRLTSMTGPPGSDACRKSWRSLVRLLCPAPMCHRSLRLLSCGLPFS